MTVQDSQLQKLYAYRKKLENDISELTWKVYSTSTILDDLYTDNLSDSSGIDDSKSTGLYIPPIGGSKGYFRNLVSISNNVAYTFASENDIIRKSLHGNITHWVSDQVQGIMYQATSNFYQWSSGRVTIRNKINALNWVFTANAIRIKFTAASSPVTIEHAAIGQWLPGTDVGTTTTPTPLLFSGNVDVIIPANSSVWSDWILFDIIYGTDYVLIVDLMDGKIQYSATSNLGFCRYRLSASSYNIAIPNESQYLPAPPSYNNFLIPNAIQYTSHWQGGHFISGEFPVSVGPLGLTEIEPGCLVDLGNGVVKTITSITGSGTSSGDIILNEYAGSSTLIGIYGNKFSNNAITINSVLGYTPTQATVAKGGVGLRINTTYPRNWDYIEGVSVTQTTPGRSTIFHFVSFNIGNTWKIFDGSDWRDVVKRESGVWYYNLSETLTPNWIATSYVDDLSTLKQSITVLANQMTGLELASITRNQWVLSNGYQISSSSRIDFAFALIPDGSNVPSISGYTVNYYIESDDISFFSNSWSSSKINPKVCFCNLILTTSESIIPNTDFAVYISTDNGQNYSQIVDLILLNTSGTQFFYRGEILDLPTRNTKSIKFKLSTFNLKDIRISSLSVGLRYT